MLLFTFTLLYKCNEFNNLTNVLSQCAIDIAIVVVNFCIEGLSRCNSATDLKCRRESCKNIFCIFFSINFSLTNLQTSLIYHSLLLVLDILLLPIHSTWLKKMSLFFTLLKRNEKFMKKSC